ncbi:MAG: universal stress protein [Gaiellaceae bacterium]
MKLILVATDGSDASRDAIRAGAGLAQSTGASLLFVHVVEGETAAQALAPALECASRLGVCAEAELATGRPADAILDLARERGADMIVVGSHGRGFVDRILCGSVSAELVKRADRPVLVARPPEYLPAQRPEPKRQLV